MYRVFFLLTLFVFNACVKSDDGYTLTGNFKGMPSQQLELQFFTFESTEVINITYTDSEGNFCFKGTLKEPGLYGLKPTASGGDQYVILFLDNTNLNVTVDAEEHEYRVVKISGNERAEKFHALQQYYSELIKKTEQFRNKLEERKPAMSAEEYASEIQRIELDFVNHIKRLIDKTSEPVHAVYLLSLLNLQEEFKYVKATIARLSASAPQSTYIKQYNSQVKFAETVLAKHGK